MQSDISMRDFVGSWGSTFIRPSLAIASIVLSVATAFAESAVLQFEAEDFNGAGDGAVWDSSDDRFTLLSEHPATNGWSLALKDGGMVCFDASTSPLAFPDSATGRVFRAIAVVACEEAAGHATLIDAYPQINALRRYLALKHGLAVPTESDGGIVATLTAMGVDTDGLFNSVFLVK